MMNRTVVVSALLGGLYALVATQGSLRAQDQPYTIAPSELTWHPVTTLPPGAEVSVIEGPLNENKPFIFRIKFGPGWKVPPHTHPVLTHVTVISGMFKLGLGSKFDEAKIVSYAPGTVIVLPPGEPHFAHMAEDTVIQVHGIGPWGTNWVDPNDDPASKKSN
jgi:quercetin dioxygenase-like cupin family protein